MRAAETSPVASVRDSGEERTARKVEGFARERLPVEQVDVRMGGGWRTYQGAEVGARERMSMGQVDVPDGGV